MCSKRNFKSVSDMKKHQTSSLFSVFFLKIYASIKNIKKYLDLFSSRKQFKKNLAL